MKKKYIKIAMFSFFSLLIVGALLFLFVFNRSKKLVCKAPEGSLTVYYNNDKLLRYEAVNLEFDLDAAKKDAEAKGVDEYIRELKNWFEANSTGKCD